LASASTRRFSAADLIAQHRNDIARIVCGELAELSEVENREILGSQMSYYPEDLLVVGLTAAFICDTPEGAAPNIQLLEYANTQLLEFRYYDALLTRLLERVYSSLDKRGGLFARWRLAREAQNLNKIRLDIRGAYRADGYLHQVPERHVLGAPVPDGRKQNRSGRLPPPGREQAPHGGRSLRVSRQNMTRGVRQRSHSMLHRYRPRRIDQTHSRTCLRYNF